MGARGGSGGGARTELDPALLEAAWGMTGHVAHHGTRGRGAGSVTQLAARVQ